MKHTLELKEKSDNILEYIDGIVYMSPSLSTKHQRISSKLHAKLYSIEFEVDIEELFK